VTEKEKIKPNTIIQTGAMPTTKKYTEEQSLAGSIELFIHIINCRMFRLKYVLQTVFLKVIVVELQLE